MSNSRDQGIEKCYGCFECFVCTVAIAIILPIVYFSSVGVGVFESKVIKFDPLCSTDSNYDLWGGCFSQGFFTLIILAIITFVTGCCCSMCIISCVNMIKVIYEIQKTKPSKGAVNGRTLHNNELEEL